MNVEGRVLSVESRRTVSPRLAVRTSATLTPDPRPLIPRHGLTLVELLITIMIIGILAAAVLGVAAVAGETAREAKTRSLVARLHTLLMAHYDTYNTRRVKVRPEVLAAINAKASLTTAQKGRLKAEARLYALRELMLMEVPDRWSDVLLEAVPPTTPTKSPWYLEVPDSTLRTDLANVYLRQYRRIANSTNKTTGTTNTAQQIRDNQGAECLYMIIMNACGDGEARTLFPESTIRDTDGDGALEFIDGWGHPIQFVRWAPGFESDVQADADKLDDPETGTLVEAWAAAGSADHDPFDLYRAQPVAYRLVPLIYSLGRDEEAGLYSDDLLVPWRPMPFTLGLASNFSGQPPYVTPPMNPYVKYTPTYYLGGELVGQKTATDNIHNHLIGTR